MVYFLKHKNEVKNIIEMIIQKVKTDTGFKVQVLRTYKCLEFVNNEVISILQELVIKHQFHILQNKTVKLNEIIGQ